ncbi:IclR family transcriptional regulator [Microtetraspora niveoalba]|uniref:IclR family transcriptional regulator n=1 Tax=Microtetraspora niveoalba TaxID=46175 RepID=UPI0009FD2F98|nr:IclR family transcriptional regulator [Microtetraspora niveoalba]
MPRTITHQASSLPRPLPAAQPPGTPGTPRPLERSSPLENGGPLEKPSSLEKAISILTSLSAAVQPVSLAELSRRTGLPKTTAYRLLGVLCAKGLTQRIGIDYAIGDRLVSLAGPGPRMIPGTRPLVLPHLVRLYERTRQTVNLAVPRGLEVAYVERVYGHGRVSSPSDEVDRAPLHCTAGGKVLLAFDHALNASFRERGTLDRMTRRTIVAHAALDRELRVVRRHGVAYAREEFAEGVVCAAAPVFDGDGGVRMAVSVACPAPSSVSGEVAALVKQTAHAVSATIVTALSAMALRPHPEGPPASFL